MACLIMAVGGIYAGKSLIFNPYAQMDREIAAATKHIQNVFENIDAALDKGKSVEAAISVGTVQPVIHRIVATSRLSGFMHAAKHSGAKVPMTYGKTIGDKSAARAAKVARLMKRTTRKVLKGTPDSQYTLSKDRAIAAARYEAARGYFQGVGDAFRGSKKHGKRWVTSAAESCEECMDNEAQGTIGIDEDFQSGHPYPTAHVNCACVISITNRS